MMIEPAESRYRYNAAIWDPSKLEGHLLIGAVRTHLSLGKNAPDFVAI